MAKLAQNFAKYVIYATLHAKGIVEKPDVIGAVFGQTEGLLGTDLDLRELQRTGRVGRIEVEIKTEKGTSEAVITIPCSLDASETALIASSLETIDKVGPCDASIEVTKVEDVRSKKRNYAIDRAKEILRDMIDKGLPDTQKISDDIKESVISWEISDYYGLSCGPDIENYDEIIVVEGRADVINLLRNGIKNVIAIEGSRIPEAVINLTKEKTTIAFLDGDRGGDLDLKKLLSVASLDFVARAPEGKEVEELGKKQIYKALRDKVPVDIAVEKTGITPAKSRVRSQPELRKIRVSGELKKMFKERLDELIGTKAVYIMDQNYEIATKIPINELSTMINDFGDISGIIIDERISQSLIDLLAKRNVEYVIATGFRERIRIPRFMKVLTTMDL